MNCPECHQVMSEDGICMESAEKTINEVWRSIDCYINYQVSNCGRVRHAKTGKMLATCKHKGGYLYSTLSQGGKSTKLYVHRLVAKEFLDNPDDKGFVDHINHNRSDNTVTNLRWVTRVENNKNTTSRRNASSKYCGVHWSKSIKRWIAQITDNGKSIHIGCFDTAEEAAEAYDERARLIHGEYANLNLPLSPN